MMKLLEKLQCLRASIDKEVLYRFTVGKHRILDGYVKLSDLRLSALSCADGLIVYSSAAPILDVRGHVPGVVFRDSDVYTVASGERMGMNIPLTYMKPDENVIETRTCGYRLLDDSTDCPKWLEGRIMGMGRNPWPISAVILPELFRITKRPESIRPLINAGLLEALGLSTDTPAREVSKAFIDNIDIFGKYTEEGIILPFDKVASGGMVIASTAGMSGGSGVVRCIPLRAFTADCARNRWSVHTAANSSPEGGGQE